MWPHPGTPPTARLDRTRQARCVMLALRPPSHCWCGAAPRGRAMRATNGKLRSGEKRMLRAARAPLPPILAPAEGRASLCGSAMCAVIGELPSREAGTLRAAHAPIPPSPNSAPPPCAPPTACRDRASRARGGVSPALRFRPSQPLLGSSAQCGDAMCAEWLSGGAVRRRHVLRQWHAAIACFEHAACRSRSAFALPSRIWGRAAPCGDVLCAANGMPRSRASSTLRAARAPLPPSSHCWGRAAPYYEWCHRRIAAARITSPSPSQGAAAACRSLSLSLSLESAGLPCSLLGPPLLHRRRLRRPRACSSSTSCRWRLHHVILYIYKHYIYIYILPPGLWPYPSCARGPGSLCVVERATTRIMTLKTTKMLPRTMTQCSMTRIMTRIMTQIMTRNEMTGPDKNSDRPG